MKREKSNWKFACITIVIALLIPSLLGIEAFGETQNVTELNDTPPENITDRTAPIITIQSPINTTYNTTGIGLNYTIDEPTEWIGYSLNGANNVTIIGNITFNADVGLNHLVVYARDTAGNSGKAEVQFTVVNINITTENITDVTTPDVTTPDVTELSDITPKLTAKKDSFSLGEEPAFTFYVSEEEPEAKKSGIAAPGESQKAFKRWMTENETIETFVYDSYGELTDIEPEIEKIREGKFSITLPKERAFRAGVYQLGVEFIKDEQVYVVNQEFPWGLVSLNTRKSIYKPGEIAEFIIVVLDKDGHSVCGADISMTVANPNNEKKIYSTSDGTILPSEECGIYNANYPTEIEGKHEIAISALINGVEVSFNTYFMVQQDYDFDIIRTAESKIDPTRQDRFEVTIDIESFTDSNFITIKEFVPASFNISTDAATVLIEDDTKTITWNKELINKRTSVSYSYSVPHVWPYLYALGPAEINYDSKTFEEARAWYVAVDPAYSSTPTAQNNTEVSTTNGTYTTLKTLTITKSGQTWLKTEDELKTGTSKKTVYVNIVATNNPSIYCENSTDSANYITFSRELDISSLTDGTQSFDLQMNTTLSAWPIPASNRNWSLYLENFPPKVEKPKTYDNITLGGKTIFHRNDGMTVRVNVTDADGASDLSKVLIKILNTTNAVKVDNATMTNITGITKGYTYEYNYTIPSNADRGTWTINVYANDTVNNWGSNTTTFDVYGYSNVTWISPPDGSEYTVGETITLTCLVRDANTSSAIENYPARFYNRTDSTVTYDFGVNYTNSSGYALMNWTTAGVAAGWYYPKGNITDNATLFYNVSTPYEANTSIKLSLATTLEIRNQTASPGITSINVSGTSGDTVTNPYNDVDGESSPQNITTTMPVVTIYNPSSSTTYKIWLKVTEGTDWDYIIKNETFNVTADATDPGEVSTWISLKPGGSWGTLVDSGKTVAPGNYKDLYLAFSLRRSGTGNATISVLAEV